MNEVKTIENNVLEILKKYPETRQDDMALILRYYIIYGAKCIEYMPFGEVLSNYKSFELPCFESIRRARQRVQSCFTELARNVRDTEENHIVLTVRIGG